MLSTLSPPPAASSSPPCCPHSSSTPSQAASSSPPCCPHSSSTPSQAAWRRAAFQPMASLRLLPSSLPLPSPFHTPHTPHTAAAHLRRPSGAAPRAPYTCRWYAAAAASIAPGGAADSTMSFA
eukprot:250439-Chlamydomonas_euryale.AAC.1